nr:hypothetical protein [Fischerella sp. PCC 9605]
MIYGNAAQIYFRQSTRDDYYFFQSNMWFCGDATRLEAEFLIAECKWLCVNG